MKIQKGTVFNTPYEKGCVANETPDGQGNFDGIDSDGVEVSFNVAMVCDKAGDKK